MEKNQQEMRGSSVIRHVMQVLRSFAPDQPAKGVTDIAAEVGLHKSSVSRILAALELEQVVEQDRQTRKYRLGLGLIAVAGPLLANLDVRRIAVEEMTQLCEEVGETVALSVWDGTAAVTVEQVPSREQVKHTSPLGSRYATSADSTVQVFLAHMERDEARSVISEALEISPTVGHQELHQRLRTVRERGAGVNRGETAPNEVGIAAPIFDHRGDVAAVLLIAAPAYRIDDSAVQNLSTGCQQAAARISVRMGYPTHA